MENKMHFIYFIGMLVVISSLHTHCLLIQIISYKPCLGKFLKCYKQHLKVKHNY